jgi:hypothetical protein
MITIQRRTAVVAVKDHRGWPAVSGILCTQYLRPPEGNGARSYDLVQYTCSFKDGLARRSRGICPGRSPQLRPGHFRGLIRTAKSMQPDLVVIAHW